MPAVNLKCGQCGFENEAERVYCHNCGGKLDRTLLPRPEEDKRHETSAKAQRRIKRMTNPTGNPAVREFKALLQTLAWGAVAAAFILMARAPDGVPDPKGGSISRLVQSELTETFESPTPRAISFTQDEINYSLKQTLKGKESGLIPGVQFSRAFLHLHPGTVRVNTQQSLWGYPLYASASYKIGMKDGKFAPTLNAGSIGRLAVHPQVMQPVIQYVDLLAFSKLWTALKRERGYLDKLQSISAEEKQLTLVTKGAK